MFFGLNLDGVFMPDFTTKLKKKMRSAPPVSLYLLEPVLQAEYQRFMPDFTTKFQNKKKAAFRLYFYVFWNRFCRQSTSAYQISYIFLLSFGTKNKNKKVLHTAVPKFLQEFLPEFHRPGISRETDRQTDRQTKRLTD